MGESMRQKLSYSTAEAAELLGVEVATLSNWRYLMKGPSYMKIGRKIVYTSDSLQKFLKAATVHPKLCG